MGPKSANIHVVTNVVSGTILNGNPLTSSVEKELREDGNGALEEKNARSKMDRQDDDESIEVIDDDDESQCDNENNVWFQKVKQMVDHICNVSFSLVKMIGTLLSLYDMTNHRGSCD